VAGEREEAFGGAHIPIAVRRPPDDVVHPAIARICAGNGMSPDAPQATDGSSVRVARPFGGRTSSGLKTSRENETPRLTTISRWAPYVNRPQTRSGYSSAHWKYPATSKKKLVLPGLPGGMSHWTKIWPPAPSGTMALLARTMPGRKLIVLASGAAAPVG
jgi:hypothetical protein